LRYLSRLPPFRAGEGRDNFWYILDSVESVSTDYADRAFHPAPECHEAGTVRVVIRVARKIAAVTAQDRLDLV
jgi:hypothetical protein